MAEEYDLLGKRIGNLSDSATNWKILREGGIGADLINRWLQNGTRLDDAIAIIRQGVNLNLIGTSDKVRDFIGLAGVSPNEIMSRIPVYAKIEHWTYLPGKAQEGMKFVWRDALVTWRLRMHSQDPNPELPAWSNAARGWVLRVQRGHYFMDADGSFYKDTTLDPTSKKYNEANANATHIPIQQP